MTEKSLNESAIDVLLTEGKMDQKVKNIFTKHGFQVSKVESYGSSRATTIYVTTSKGEIEVDNTDGYWAVTGGNALLGNKSDAIEDDLQDM